MSEPVPEELREYLDEMTRLAIKAKEAFTSNGPRDLPAFSTVFYEHQEIMIPVGLIMDTEQMHPMTVLSQAFSQIRRDHGPPSGVMVCVEGYGTKTTEEELRNHIRGSNAERFARGDPTVFEAVMLTVADHAWTVLRTLPFHYGDGTVQWDEVFTDVTKTMSTEALRSNMGSAILTLFREEGVAN